MVHIKDQADIFKECCNTDVGGSMYVSDRKSIGYSFVMLPLAVQSQGKEILVCYWTW